MSSLAQSIHSQHSVTTEAPAFVSLASKEATSHNMEHARARRSTIPPTNKQHQQQTTHGCSDSTLNRDHQAAGLCAPLGLGAAHMSANSLHSMCNSDSCCQPVSASDVQLLLPTTLRNKHDTNPNLVSSPRLLDNTPTTQSHATNRKPFTPAPASCRLPYCCGSLKCHKDGQKQAATANAA